MSVHILCKQMQSKHPSDAVKAIILFIRKVRIIGSRELYYCTKAVFISTNISL